MSVTFREHLGHWFLSGRDNGGNYIRLPVTPITMVTFSVNPCAAKWFILFFIHSMLELLEFHT